MEYALLELHNLLFQQGETLLDVGHRYSTRGCEQCEEWTACGDKDRGGANVDGVVVGSLGGEFGLALRSSFLAAKAYSSSKSYPNLARLTSCH